MSTHYLTQCHAPSLVHVKCLLESIRRFDEMSPITVIFDDGISGSDMDSVRAQFNLESAVRHGEFEADCRKEGKTDFSVKKSGMSPRDFAWTAQACMPYWALGRIRENWLVYMDADVYNFQPFQPVIEAIPEKACVGVCRHRYPPGKENIDAGVYNNGISVWLNSSEAMEHALRWGCETIERWTPNHLFKVPHEQKLLDDWPLQLGDMLCELPAEVDWGPWRLTDMSIHPIDKSPMLPIGEYHEIEGQQLVPLQSTHMHEFRRGAGLNPVVINGQQFNRCNYPLHPATIEAVYLPYESAMAKYL